MGKKQRRRKVSPPPTAEDFAAEASGKTIRFTQRDTLAHMLETAIELWFREGEPLSIHLIASAVYRCLDDLSSRIGKLRTEVGHEQFTLVYDYLRHAWPNRDTELVFPTGANRWLIFEATGAFEKFFRCRSPYMSVFQLYFVLYCLSRPVTSEELAEFLPDKIPVETLLNLKREEFVDKTLPFFAGSAGPAKASLWAFRRAHSEKSS
jgi:hypothetical protein